MTLVRRAPFFRDRLAIDLGINPAGRFAELEHRKKCHYLKVSPFFAS